MSPGAWVALCLLLTAGLVMSAFRFRRARSRQVDRCAISDADTIAELVQKSDILPTTTPSELMVGHDSTSLDYHGIPSPEGSDTTPLGLPTPVADPFKDEEQTGPVTISEQDSARTDTFAEDDGLPLSDGQTSERNRDSSPVSQHDAQHLDDAKEHGEERDEFPLMDDLDAMRITKRSSGGRGEYEISETFAQLTPRDLLGHALVLDLGEGLTIPSGIRLLDRNGKLRLRIDASLGAEIHLHRQLAVALLMPYPARGESVWGSGWPVIQSDRYGIGNIELSHVELRPDEAVIVPGCLEIANSDQNAAVDCAERLQQVRLLWHRRSDLPSAIATLLDQHQQEISRNVPLGPRTEAIVADLQRATAAHAHNLAIAASETADAVPLLLELLSGQEQCSASPFESPESSVAEAVVPPAKERTSPVPPEPTPVEATESPSESVLTTPVAKSVVVDQTENVPSPEPEVVGESSEDTPLLPEPVSPEDQAEPRLLPPTRQVAAPEPRRYQPQARIAAPKKRNAIAPTPRLEASERSCPIEVRLRNRVGGAFTLSLLPRRREGMPEEIEVSGAGDSPLALSALHESWYQDIVLADMAAALATGVAWHAEGSAGRLQWALSGRDLYVLGPRDELSGFVSTPRLTLNEQHVVICIERLRDQVAEVLKQCCGTVPASIDPEDGLPQGWAGFRGVSPVRALPPSHTPDIIDALRPAPDLQIRLRGGIRLQYWQWLLGFPPAIQAVGADAHEQLAVTIDGLSAVAGPDLAFTAVGWDRPGEHIVACSGITRSYSLTPPPDGWESWPAHARNGTLAVCGGMVRSASSASRSRADVCVVVPVTNSLLLGSNPGEVYLCSASAGFRLGFCGGSPPFRPVWAVPATPLHADKPTSKILFLDWPMPRRDSESTTANGGTVRRWMQAIVDCSRKGLRLADESPQTQAVWRAYCQQARAIWRGRR